MCVSRLQFPNHFFFCVLHKTYRTARYLIIDWIITGEDLVLLSSSEREIFHRHRQATAYLSIWKMVEHITTRIITAHTHTHTKYIIVYTRLLLLLLPTYVPSSSSIFTRQKKCMRETSKRKISSVEWLISWRRDSDDYIRSFTRVCSAADVCRCSFRSCSSEKGWGEGDYQMERRRRWK